MTVEHDAGADAVYIRFSQGEVGKTISLSRYIHCDLDAEGKPVGLEVLFASQTVEGLKEALDRRSLDCVPLTG